MDHLAAAASATATMAIATTNTVSATLFPSISASSAKLPHVLRRCFVLFLHAILRLLLILLSPLLLSPNSKHISASSPSPGAVSGDTAAARALSHVLNLITCVPVSSRKYHLLRALADRLLDENLPAYAPLNRAALSVAFSQSIHRLEISIASSSSYPDHLSLVSAVRSGLRMLAPAVGTGEVTGGGEAALEAEKVAAELLWIAGKIADCGGAGEAVARWGAAKGLARLALEAEPRLQVALVRVSVLLFKHIDAKQAEEGDEEEEEYAESSTGRRRMAMLTSWLPLLCRASNGTDAPALTGAERSQTVRVLEETIAKLSRDEQEEVLALWLHHFTSSPDSDWPNLEGCYTRWYSDSRKLLLK